MLPIFCAKTIVKESHNFELAHLKEEKAKEEKEEEIGCSNYIEWLPWLQTIQGDSGYEEFILSVDSICMDSMDT